MFGKGMGSVQGNTTSFQGSGFGFEAEHPEGSKVVHKVLAINQVGHVLRVDLQDV